jgi:hypothetical protein
MVISPEPQEDKKDTSEINQEPNAILFQLGKFLLSFAKKL